MDDHDLTSLIPDTNEDTELNEFGVDAAKGTFDNEVNVVAATSNEKNNPNHNNGGNTTNEDYDDKINGANAVHSKDDNNTFEYDVYANNCNKNNSDDDKSNKVKNFPEEDGSKSFEYDVFISYSCCDRPWVRDVLLPTLEQEGKTVCIDYRDFPAGRAITDNVVHAIENSHVTILVLTPAFVESEWCMFESKHALMSSLATTKARVLPLILMECEMPNILKHLTYLDHTSEDVQPYFNKQLIDSLEKAKIWSPKIDQLSGDIVPISDVQEVVTKTLDEKEERKNAYSKLNGAHGLFLKNAFRIITLVIVAIVLVLVIHILCASVFLYLAIKVDWIYYNIPLQSSTSETRTLPMSFSVFEVKGDATDNCQLITTSETYMGNPTLANIYAFNKPLHNVIYAKINEMHHNQTFLSPSRLYKHKKSSIASYEFRTLKFCFQSENPHANALLWVYTFEREFPASNKFHPRYLSLNPTKYNISGKSRFCNQSNDNDNFVFYNAGPSGILLNVTNFVKILTYRSQLAESSCLNSSECRVRTPPKYIIIPRKGATADNRQFVVACVTKFSKALFGSVSLLVLFVLCFSLWAFQNFFFKKYFPRSRKRYFEKENVRKSLGETAVKMIDESDDLGELFKKIKEENKKYTFVLE